MADTGVHAGDSGASKSRNTAIRAGIVIAVLVLLVLGIEAFRQFRTSSSVGGVESAFEESIDYFGRPTDWQAHFETRRGKIDGAPQVRKWAAKYGSPDVEVNGKLTYWLQALLKCGSTGTMPTEAELASLRESCAGLDVEAQELIAFTYLDGVPLFLPNGEVTAEMDWFHAMRKLQVLAAADLVADSRDAAMAKTELLLELTTRRLSPFGMFDMLVMSVLEPYTHVLVGRLLEGGTLSARSAELVTKLQAAPNSALTIVEGELVQGAWRYHVVGIEAMAVDAGSGWFAWSTFGGESGTNDLTAENQRALLELCEAYKQGRQPTPDTEFGRAIKRNIEEEYACLKTQRTRSTYAAGVRLALAEGADPGASLSEAATAGIKIEPVADGWRVAFVGDGAQRKALGHPEEAEFNASFPPFVLR